jgi:hypothetical protein
MKQADGSYERLQAYLVFLCMFFSNTEPLTNPSFECIILRRTRTCALRCGNTFAFATANFKYIYNLYCSVREPVPDAGLQKRDTLTRLIVDAAGTGNRTRATSAAASGASRSAIHYDSSVSSQMRSWHRMPTKKDRLCCQMRPQQSRPGSLGGNSPNSSKVLSNDSRPVSKICV